MGERDLRELASVLLCVETFAYFSEGQVWLNDQVYFCHPGEWITSYTEIEELTGIDRRQVKKYLVKLENNISCLCRMSVLQADCVGQL